MSEFVRLCLKRNRGWPWPENSYGLTPMFGADGWCHACGVPEVAQNGNLVLQSRGLTPQGAWVPNWRFDALCVDGALAGLIIERFRVQVRPVHWPTKATSDAFQLMIPVVGDGFYSDDDLQILTNARHGSPGARCAECGTWRWYPLNDPPPVRNAPSLEGHVIAASPEWFGDGWQSYREIIVRRDLAELIAAASPRDFRVEELAT